ncbi:MAG: CBS domain-containing protein [Methanobrevibacter sp.]|jgi:IMP dehydrogenase|nr:CBS domain-containing protein [Candidatus Methanovirga aequatorialis]
MSKKSIVKEYMTKNVTNVHPKTSRNEIIKVMKETGHDGFPVVNENNEITGFITSFDFIIKDHADLVKDIMSTDVIVAQEDMSINDTARVMFRHGVSKLPVVDKDGKLKGIITNTDMVRSNIERTTPNKVKSFKETLEQLYAVKTALKRMKVRVNNLRPTQDKIFADELQGREYELKRGLIEPVIVAKTGSRWILIDGHHRAVASVNLKHEEIDAYVIELNKDVKLGMERTADKSGIYTFDDIKIIDDDQHPLVSITESIKKENDKKELNELSNE